MDTAYRINQVNDDPTVCVERCVGASQPQSISNDLEQLEKWVGTLGHSLRDLNGQLDAVLNPEGSQDGASIMKASLAVCPLAERIRRITATVQDLDASVDGIRRRLAL